MIYLENIRDQYYTPKDDHDAKCPNCFSIDIGVEQSISKEGVASISLVCNECGIEFL